MSFWTPFCTVPDLYIIMTHCYISALSRGVEFVSVAAIFNPIRVLTSTAQASQCSYLNFDQTVPYVGYAPSSVSVGIMLTSAWSMMMEADGTDECTRGHRTTTGSRTIVTNRGNEASLATPNNLWRIASCCRLVIVDELSRASLSWYQDKCCQLSR